MATTSFLVEKSDRIDRIAREAYGTEGGGTVEALLDANPGLADVVDAVPVGLRLTVPDVVQAGDEAVRPWI
ncbi:tail protein X [Aureimonas sp. ME7]|uniref:tail protein X n=1 Tax=Aureimonas sp. ME7 TaxID=2744252 RepID=UPI0015F5D57E|nr:tail protein X [Aureimonas sp. ME7]